MATFADKFLQDIDDLSDDEDFKEPLSDDENDEEDKDFVEYQEREQKVEKLLAKGYQSKVRDNPEFTQHIQQLEASLEGRQVDKRFENLSNKEIAHQLIIKTNEYLKHIDNDILIVHKQLRDLYANKFGELESIILNPIEYARAVQIIGNIQGDISHVSEQLQWLKNSTVLSINVSFSANTGRQLSEKEYEEVIRLSGEVLDLEANKQKMLNFLENRMLMIAPNVSAIVGTRVAAKLIASAGGIIELSRIPAGNIQVIGSQKKALNGLSTASANLHRGHLQEVDLAVQAPPAFSMQIIRMLSTKTALAARVDACGTCSNGSEGKKLREGILQRFDKIIAPQQPKLRKPLPKPDSKVRKKRAGRKFRNMRLKYQMTEARKAQNIMPFGAEAQKEYRETGKGMGMIGMAGGKLRVGIQKDQKILKKRPMAHIPGQGSGAASGLASSVVMSAHQGMELINPDLLQRQVKLAQGNDSYFSSKSGFSTVINLKKSSMPPPTVPARPQQPKPSMGGGGNMIL